MVTWLGVGLGFILILFSNWPSIEPLETLISGALLDLLRLTLLCTSIKPWANEPEARPAADATPILGPPTKFVVDLNAVEKAKEEAPTISLISVLSSLFFF